MADEKKFATARTRELLASELEAGDVKAIADIEEFGCHLIHVSGSEAAPGWSYSLGVFDTCGQPELIVVGLKPDTAQSALNKAIRDQRNGVILTNGRHREMVGEVEVEFRFVDPEWVKELMGWAKWFNGSWDFPVLQMIYPDLENRFQWEEGFTEYFRQPLLQHDAIRGRTEEDLKLSLDSKSSFFDWKFSDPPHTSSYVSKTVNDGDEPVTYVSHDADGDWQFLGDSMSEGGGPVVVCLHHPIDKDASLKELADLPVGWVAEREAVGEPWVRREHEPVEEDG